MIDPVKGSASRGPIPAGDSASRGQTGTYLGVATDHVIESFRNRLWADYKTGAGIDPALLAQFHPLEEALAAMGVVVWPMIELEADVRSLRPRISRRKTNRSRKSPFGRPIRIWRNACEARA